MAEPVLSVAGLGVQTKRHTLLKDVSFEVRAGEIVALLGPNGAGKSTLLRACFGLTALSGGRARIGGADVAGLAAAQKATLCAYLPQDRAMAWPLRVVDCVALGRFAHGAAPSRLSPADAEAVARAMAACAITHLSARAMDTLSGGEAARVHVARAFAAQTPLILADEPIAALDPHHALRVMGLFAAHRAAGGAALIALHDLDMALRFADRCVVIEAGAVLAQGPPAQILTPELLARAYQVQARLLQTEQGARLVIDAPAG